MWESFRKKLIVKLGGYLEKGYPDAESAIEAVKDTKERRRLLTLAVKKCFNTIGPEDILQANGSQWIVDGKPISNGEKDRLIAEAVQFEESYLWKVLKLDIKHQANKTTFLKARTDDDLTAGKLWHWTLDALSTRMKSLSKGSPLYNSEPRK